MSQRLVYRTLNKFDEIEEQQIIVQDFVDAEIVSAFLSFFSFGKLAATHDVMLLTTWSDGESHGSGGFVTHIRFGPPERGVATVVGHEQGIHERDAGPT